MMHELLGQVGDAGMGDKTVAALVGGVTTLVLGVIGLMGKQRFYPSQKNRVTLEEPVPTVPVRRVYQTPTWDQHVGLERRVSVLEDSVREIRHEGGQREARLSDKIADLASRESATARAVEIMHQTLIAMTQKLDALIVRTGK